MLGPDPVVVGDQPPVAPGPDPLEVGDHLDPPADHPGVHGVVVGVQPDVVVPAQPGARPPPDLRWDRGQRQHRLPVGVDPVARGAAQRAPMPPVRDRQPGLQLGVEVAR